MGRILTEKEIKEMYNLDDEGFKRAAMNVVALEVLEKYNVSPWQAKLKMVPAETAKKITEDFKREWQETKEAFGWE
jgi:hypothetical protein